MDVRWFVDRWWVYMHGRPYRWARLAEVWAYADVFQYDLPVDMCIGVKMDRGLTQNF